MRKMKIFRVVVTFFLLKNVLCKDLLKIPNNNLVKMLEKVQNTIIVAYNKIKMTKDEIEKEKMRIEKECECKVENLACVGAFVLTYDNPSQRAAVSLNLDPSKMVAADNHFISISNEGIPTDPDFFEQWALQDLDNNADINAAEGWKEYMSDANGGDPNGPSVVVAVIDTGVDYNHPDLKDAMWSNPGEVPGNGKDDDGNGIVDDVHGASFTWGDETGDPGDVTLYHGTHNAGIIAAKENNRKGVAGVTSFTQGKVKIMAVRGMTYFGVPFHGDGVILEVVKSWNYAICNGATILSNSWGDSAFNKTGTDDLALFKMLLQNNPNHLFVAAADNGWLEIYDNDRPLLCGIKEPNLLCVASSTRHDTLSSFSNFGKEYVHVVAPGSDIYSTGIPAIPHPTWPNDTSYAYKSAYACRSGTSMACPHVSGLAALMRTMRPEMTAQQIRRIIEANVQKKEAYENIVSSGGLIDMGKTIRALKGDRK